MGLMRAPAGRASGVLAIIQARLGSVRFPRKVLEELDGKPLVEFMIERVRQSTQIDEIVLAVPHVDLNSPLSEIANRQGIAISGGPSDDVLGRFAAVALANPHDTIVRLTADCPLVDPQSIDSLILEFVETGVDYLRTGTTFPDGLDVEVMRNEVLLLADDEATDPNEREHVTTWITKHPELRRAVVEYPVDLGGLRLTVDEPVDLDVVRNVLTQLPPHDRDLNGIRNLWTRDPEQFAANSHLGRDEGSALTDSQKLWRRAQRVIPGGVSLLSKRPDMQLPDKWPTYFSEAKGCWIKSLDGQEYIDTGLMGVGTSILGFGDRRVDAAVSEVIRKGTISTLNCPEEVLLAERLVELHAWSGQARFARSGGEACAMAVRIGRAASGKDRVAVSGYHGWHDWYLAANLKHDSSLDDHLLPGLSTRGVPRALRGTTAAFEFGRFDQLEAIVAEGNVGVIVMEVERSRPPAPGFLEMVRDLATREGIVLVFDESTSGFRQVLGGHHLTLNVYPDIAVFGKTLGNGYAITAVLGRDCVMDVAKELFLSSTFWSERIGPAAAVASLSVMEEENAPQRIHEIGLKYRSLLSSALEGDSSNVEYSGLPALTSLQVQGEIEPMLFKTYFTTVLMEYGFLAGPTLYAALPHESHLEEFADRVSDATRSALRLGSRGIRQAIRGQRIATSGFARLA